MKSLLFRYSYPRFVLATLVGRLTPRAFFSPIGSLGLADMPEPTLPGEDWVIVRTACAGVCGSDVKEVFLEGNSDNPITALISFPAVLGHEVAGTIEAVGRGVSKRHVGERVVISPWLSCAPRGISPVCRACAEGNYFACENFTAGRLPPGIHLGNSRGAPGAFAPRLSAHESQCFPIPDGVSFEQAVFADPFSVSLHAILKAPPHVVGRKRERATALVYGMGTLGLLSVMILNTLYPDTYVIGIARHPHQRELAARLGADEIISAKSDAQIIERVAEITGAKVNQPWRGLSWLLDGADVIYDTVGSARSLEVGIRVAAPRGYIVVTGVDVPRRFEWTPLYFKEINMIGSNAFGMETFNRQRKHTFEIYLELLASKRVDPTPLITHRFSLEQYREAFVALHDKRRSSAVKALFQFSA